MGKKKNESVLPKAPWLSVSLKGKSHARTSIDEYALAKGESHPLEDVAKGVTILLLTVEFDSVPVPDVSYKLDDEPVFTLTFVKANRRLVCHFSQHDFVDAKPRGFASERTIVQEGIEDQVVQHEDVARNAIDEFRKLVSWLVYGEGQ